MGVGAGVLGRATTLALAFIMIKIPQSRVYLKTPVSLILTYP